MSIVGYLVTPEPEGREAKDGKLAPVISGYSTCPEHYTDVDDYDPVLRAHCRLSDEPGSAAP
jgi:hypothetical protein